MDSIEHTKQIFLGNYQIHDKLYYSSNEDLYQLLDHVDITNKKVLFQCKRWVANVDSTPIQRLHSMKIVYGDEISKAICVTTSNYTSEAKIVANQTKVELIRKIKRIIISFYKFF